MVRSTLLCFFGLWWPSGHEFQLSPLLPEVGPLGHEISRFSDHRSNVSELSFKWKFKLYVWVRFVISRLVTAIGQGGSKPQKFILDGTFSEGLRKQVHRDVLGCLPGPSIPHLKLQVLFSYGAKHSPLFLWSLVALRARISGIQLICDSDVLLTLRIVFSYGSRDTS